MPGLSLPTIPALATVWQKQLDDYVVALQWQPHGETLAVAAAHGHVTLIKSDGQAVGQLFAHKNGINSLSWSADGSRLATGGQDGYARIWDANTGRCLDELRTDAQWVECAAYSPIQEFLVITAGRTLAVWDTTTRLLERYPDQPNTIADAQWQPGSLFFAVARYGKLSIYRVGSTEPIKEFTWKGSILKIAWSPDGDFIATGNQDATVHFWYRKTGRDLEMSGYVSKIRELSWDANSCLLATGGGAAVTVWNCSGKGPAGRRPLELAGHADLVRTLSFQGKGTLLASGGKDGRVCVWKTKGSEQLAGGIEFSSGISQLAWCRNDRLLAVGTEEGMVAVLNAP
jgi:WD40 repeat protein